MILQSLVKLYDDLVSRGEIARFGWSPTKISYALCLDTEGNLIQVVPQLVVPQSDKVSSGKKPVFRPTQKILPAAVKRASGILPNFLWDNSIYILGFRKFDEKRDGKKIEKPENGLVPCPNHFEASREFHHSLLNSVHTQTAQAILNFFDTWDYKDPSKFSLLSDDLDGILSGGNLIFRVDGIFAQDDPEIQAAWQAHYEKADGVKMQCLTSGRMEHIERLHPDIKGIKGSPSRGAPLVTFDKPAFCSYGKKQNLNAPVGKHAAFAYTSALNYLLADSKNVQHIGDTTVVCWADGADPKYTAFSCAALFGNAPPQGFTDSDLRSAVKRLANGLPCEKLSLDPNRQFYILGLAPNAARISVRFFLRNSFGAIMQNINAHHERMEIAGSKYQIIPLWAMLKETVNPHSTDKSPSPAMSGATARAIFSGTPYPASLLEAVTIRIRAERNITPGRAAIIKAYYLKNPTPQCPKEVLTVSLNKNSTNIPYTLGRLFSIYEAVQEGANPGINATIKDKYFNSASSTPATIFPILDNLCQKHLRKLDTGMRIYFDRQICDLKDRLGEAYPLRLTLPEQGSFNLGYYHQYNERFTKKEDK